MESSQRSGVALRVMFMVSVLCFVNLDLELATT